MCKSLVKAVIALSDDGDHSLDDPLAHDNLIGIIN